MGKRDGELSHLDESQILWDEPGCGVFNLWLLVEG